jgi:hypothetical protein
MAIHNEVETSMVVSGRPVVVRLIENPTIDDVVITQARLYAAVLEGSMEDIPGRVDRGIREYLIRLGVER